MIGGSGDDFLLGGAGDDFLNGGGGVANPLQAAVDAEVFGDLIEIDPNAANAGNDIIDGQEGNDTLQVDGNSTDYTVEILDGGGFLLTGNDSTAVVTNVEQFLFLFDGVSFSAEELTELARSQA